MLLLDAARAKILGQDAGNRQERRPRSNACQGMLGKLFHFKQLSPIRKVSMAFTVIYDSVGNGF